MQTSKQKLQVNRDEHFRKIREIDSKLYKEHREVYSVSVNTVLGARAHEIEELEKSMIQQEFSKNKRAFQRLPRYKRRRQMSANPHLVPRNLRRGAINETDLTKRVQQRRKRKIKKRHNQRTEYWKQFQPNTSSASPLDELGHLEARKEKRLSTHVFHAKRMHMQPKWGFRLPVLNTQKNFRISNRFTRQHATIHDISYHVCIQIEGKTNCVKQLIQVLANKDIKSEFIIDGKVEGQFVMYDHSIEEREQEELRCLGPVSYLFRTFDEYEENESSEDDCYSAVMMWIHAASLPESFNYIHRVSRQITSSDHLEIIYRNDLVRFEIRGLHSTTVLKKLLKPNTNCTAEAKRTWSHICSKLVRADSLPRNMVTCLEVDHPLSSSIRKIQQFAKKKDIPSPEELSDEEELMVTIPDGIAYSEVLWRKLEAEEKIPNQSTQNFDKESVSVMLVQKDGCASKSARLGFGAGWDLICSTQHAVHLWGRMANMKNVLVLSLQDRTVLRLDQGLPTFPFDFPDSNAFYAEQPENEFKLIQSLVHESYAEQRCTMKRISISMPWGGNAANFDTIYQCQHPEEVNEIRREKSAIENIKTKGNHCTIECKDRRAIGFLTSTTYSLMRSFFYGIGYITEEGLTQLKQQQQNAKSYVVLIGGPTTDHLRPCLLSL